LITGGGWVEAELDTEQGVPVLFDAGHGHREAVLVEVGEAVCGRPGRIEGRGMSHRKEVRHDLGRVLVGELGPDVGQAVEPAPDADPAGEDGLDGADAAGGAVGGDRSGGTGAPERSR